MNPLIIFNQDMTPLRKLLLMHVSCGGKLTEYTETGNPVSFETNVAKPLSVVAAFSPVQAGSGDPSPENVRPITGCSGATVLHMADDLLSLNRTAGYAGDYSNTTKRVLDYTKRYNGLTSNNYNDTSYTESIEVDPDRREVKIKSTNSAYGAGFPFAVNGGETYYIYAEIADDNSNGLRYSFYEQDGTWISGGTITPTEKKIYEGITAPANAVTMCIIFVSPANVERIYRNICVSTSAIKSVSVTFPAEAGTVYGGTLDLTTGVLEVGWLVFDWENDLVYSNPSGSASVFKIPYHGLTHDNTFMSNIFSQSIPVGNTGRGVNVDNGDMHIVIADSELESVDVVGAKKWLREHNAIIISRRATPLVYQLTPEEILSLVGDNVLWSDLNGDMTVTYKKKG